MRRVHTSYTTNNIHTTSYGFAAGTNRRESAGHSLVSLPVDREGV